MKAKRRDGKAERDVETMYLSDIIKYLVMRRKKIDIVAWPLSNPLPNRKEGQMLILYMLMLMCVVSQSAMYFNTQLCEERESYLVIVKCLDE